MRHGEARESGGSRAASAGARHSVVRCSGSCCGSGTLRTDAARSAGRQSRRAQQRLSQTRGHVLLSEAPAAADSSRECARAGMRACMRQGAHVLSSGCSHPSPSSRRSASHASPAWPQRRSVRNRTMQQNLLQGSIAASARSAAQCNATQHTASTWPPPPPDLTVNTVQWPVAM